MTGETEQTRPCPTCGAELRVHTADEGTSSYEVVAEARLAQAESDRAELLTLLTDLVPENPRPGSKTEQLAELVERLAGGQQ